MQQFLNRFMPLKAEVIDYLRKMMLFSKDAFFLDLEMIQTLTLAL